MMAPWLNSPVLKRKARLPSKAPGTVDASFSFPAKAADSSDIDKLEGDLQVVGEEGGGSFEDGGGDKEVGGGKISFEHN